MKATKIIALCAFACLSLTVVDVRAQSDDDDPPPMMSEFGEGDSESTTDTYNETVTIDEGNSSATGEESSANGGFVAEPERKENLRVYSGKHDGNNVISDPRR